MQRQGRHAAPRAGWPLASPPRSRQAQRRRGDGVGTEAEMGSARWWRQGRFESSGSDGTVLVTQMEVGGRPGWRRGGDSGAEQAASASGCRK